MSEVLHTLLGSLQYDPLVALTQNTHCPELESLGVKNIIVQRQTKCYCEDIDFAIFSQTIVCTVKLIVM
jgi:hypothetical protein